MESVVDEQKSEQNVAAKDIAVNPPVFYIPEGDDKDPFEHDLFEREPFCRSIISLIEQSRKGFVICIDAPWGEGKTVFAELFKTLLKREGKESVYYNSYKYDYFDDPYTSILSEIRAITDEGELKKAGKVKKGMKELASKAAPFIAKMTGMAAGMAAKAAISANGGGATETELAGTAAEQVTKDLGQQVLNRLTQCSDEYKSVEEFKKELSELGQEVKEVQGLPLVIVIDELDRCRPDFAMKVIERIKHFFNVDNVIFVLMANVPQLKNYVKTVYGSGVDAHNYLHKFFTVYAKLPTKSSIDGQSNIEKYIDKLWHYHDLQLDNGDNHVIELTKYLCILFNVSHREVEQLFTRLALFYHCFAGYLKAKKEGEWQKIKGVVEEHFCNLFIDDEDSQVASVYVFFFKEDYESGLVIILAFLAVKFPETYKILAEGGITLKEFNDDTFFKTIYEKKSYIVATESNCELYLLALSALINKKGDFSWGTDIHSNIDKMLINKYSYYFVSFKSNSCYVEELSINDIEDYYKLRSPDEDLSKYIPNICDKLSTFIMADEIMKEEVKE